MNYSVTHAYCLRMAVRFLPVVFIAGIFTTAAAQITNPGFETGNLAGWSASANVAVASGLPVTVSGSTWFISPAGTYQAVVQPTGIINQATAETNLGLPAGALFAFNNSVFNGTSGATDFGTLAQTITLAANQSITMHWNYVSRDYAPYNDGVMAMLSGPGYQDIRLLAVTVNAYGSGAIVTGSYGSTGWHSVTFTAPAAGTYTLAFAAFNGGDQDMDPVFFVDGAPGATSNPGEPVVDAVSAAIASCSALAINSGVISQGNTPVTTRGFVWNTTGVPTIADHVITAGSGTGSFSATLTGLNAGTVYHVRSFAGDGTNTVYGVEVLLRTDTTAPLAPSLPNVTGDCSVTVTAPVATDNCAGQVTGTTIDPLIYNTQGTYTIHWLFNDGNGNASGANQTVIVQDITPPVPDIASLPTVNGACSATVSIVPHATDNCAGAITATTTDPISYTTQGTYAIHWNYNDGRGNTTTQLQMVIVQDNIYPTITAPANIVLNGYCQPVPASAPAAALGTPYTADNCGVATVTNNAPAAFPLGTTTVIWRVTDYNGNSSTANQTVTVLAGTVSVTPSVVPLYTLSGQEPQTIYLNYPAGTTTGQSVNVVMTPTSGAGGYTYAWMRSGCNNSSMFPLTAVPNTASDYTFSPTLADLCSGNDDNVFIFSATITDSHGCATTQTRKVNVVNPWMVNGNVIVCHKVAIRGGNTSQLLIIPPAQVPMHLSHGDMLGNCVTFNGGKSTPELQKVQEAVLYPNPATGLAFLELSYVQQGGNILVMDMQGRTIVRQVLEQTDHVSVSTIDISRYPKGLYMVLVNDGDFNYHTKLVVQ